MELASRQLGAVTIVDLSGRAAGDDHLQLRDVMGRLQSLGYRRIIINVEGLQYLDSAMLGELVACQLRASRLGVPLKLVNATRRLEDLLVITRLITVFETHDSVADAVDSFTDPPTTFV